MGQQKNKTTTNNCQEISRVLHEKNRDKKWAPQNTTHLRHTRRQWQTALGALSLAKTHRISSILIGVPPPHAANVRFPCVPPFRRTLMSHRRLTLTACSLRPQVRFLPQS